MLLSLQGITHQVHTGVGVVFPSASGGPLVVQSFAETTRVTFAPLEVWRGRSSEHVYNVFRYAKAPRMHT